MSLLLFGEVGGTCPKCSKPLIKISGGNKVKIFEVAHIYPHSPLPHEAELLKDEELLNDDVDHEDNLVALCRDCHKVFDNPRTVEGYQEMVLIKKELQRQSSLKNGWYSNDIEAELNTVVASLANIAESEAETAELSYAALKVDSKSDKTLKVLVKRKIITNVTYFYNTVMEQFAELDRNQSFTSDAIYSQVKTYYIKLKKDGMDQTQIFYALTAWMKNNTSCESTEVAEIIVSFFVQNCEVYS